MKTAIIFIILFCAANLTFGQKSEAAAYKVQAKNGSLTIKFRNKSYRYNVREQIDAARITETKLMFASEKDGFRYLVIDASGWSREKQDDRQCGAGTESNLLWLKIDFSWKIAAIKSVRYESCWSSTELNDSFKITETSLDVDFDNIGEKTNVKLSYDSREPEKGFQIAETKLKEN